MVYLMHWAQLRCLINLLFFDIPLLHCYTSLNSSIICCLSSGDMYILNVNINSSIISKIYILFGTNLNSSIICCLSSGDMYLFLGVALSTSNSVSSFGNSLVEFFETLAILSATLLPIKSPVASAVSWIALFETVFIAYVVDFLALSRNFWPYLLLKLLPIFLSKDKNPYPFKYILSLGLIEYLIFIFFI